jgi:hypothetical protein
VLFVALLDMVCCHLICGLRWILVRMDLKKTLNWAGRGGSRDCRWLLSDRANERVYLPRFEAHCVPWSSLSQSIRHSTPSTFTTTRLGRCPSNSA